MTKDEFEEGYAKRSGVTVEWLHDQNHFGFPCDCGEDGCMGWQMIHYDFCDDCDPIDNPKCDKCLGV